MLPPTGQSATATSKLAQNAFGEIALRGRSVRQSVSTPIGRHCPFGQLMPSNSRVSFEGPSKMRPVLPKIDYPRLTEEDFVKHKLLLSAMAAATAVVTLCGGLRPAEAQQQQKPNILFIMGDDIGWMQPSIYHQGLMVGETPNIDKIGQEGAKFTDYYAEQSCTAGRNAFFTGMHPLRTGMIPPQLPGSPTYLKPWHAGARQIPD